MYNTGYVMLDMKGFNLTSGNQQVIPGIWNALTEALSTGKPIYVANCTKYGEQNLPVPPFNTDIVVTMESPGYAEFYYHDMQVSIEADDVVNA